MAEDKPDWAWRRIVAGYKSQREVERRLGWKSGYLSWIEKGARPRPDQEADLRRLYGLPEVQDAAAE